MSSKKDFTAKIRAEGKITIPSAIREKMNLEQGDIINVSVNKPEWYEMLDWSQMDSALVNFNAFPSDAQAYIASSYSCDLSGKTWGIT